jgi:CBS domain-containing membrane protein
MRVAEVMSPAWIGATTDTPLAEVAVRMYRLGIRHLPVVRTDGTLVGTISDAAVFALGRVEADQFLPFRPVPRLDAGTLADVAPVVAGPDDALSSVMVRLARTRLDHVVVVDERMHPVGLVTEHALLEVAVGALPADLTVDLLLERELVTLPATSSAAAALQRMTERRFRHLPVVGPDGGLAGVVSFRDLIAADVYHRDVPLSAVHSRDVFSVPRGATLERCARRMLEFGVGCLPVVDRGRPVGIVTRRDLVTAAVAWLGCDGHLTGV